MAPKRNEMILVLAIFVMTWHGAWAQSTCANALMSLAPCLNSVTGSSLGPPSSCCSQLNRVIQNQPECLCALINGSGAALGVVASPAMALALPGACSLQSPSVSQCNVATGPTASAATPASAPIGSQSSGFTPSDISSSDTPRTTTPATPSQTSFPSSAGASSKTVPSTNKVSSGAAVTKSPFSVAILLLLAVSFYLSNSKF